jgi:hypothetical protein
VEKQEKEEEERLKYREERMFMKIRRLEQEKRRLEEEKKRLLDEKRRRDLEAREKGDMLLKFMIFSKRNIFNLSEYCTIGGVDFWMFLIFNT